MKEAIADMLIQFISLLMRPSSWPWVRSFEP